MYLSVIIPTRNRSRYLSSALESLTRQTYPRAKFEVIVVDNGSTDTTQEICASLTKKIPQLRYFYEGTPGLHIGRHRGAKAARGRFLLFLDDDTIADPGWLDAVCKAFEQPDIALVGGKILPLWEGDVPDWIDIFRSKTRYGWTIGYLSLLDFGDTSLEAPAEYIYGCNFSIRKSILFECGGFHPDAMPQELIRFRGDGETALALRIRQSGYKVLYEPRATVFHRIPPERLTIDYFCRRAFNQGISDSFREIRQRSGLYDSIPLNNRSGTLALHIRKTLRHFLIWKKKFRSEDHLLMSQVARSHEEGRSFHQNEVSRDPALLSYVLKENYF